MALPNSSRTFSIATFKVSIQGDAALNCLRLHPGYEPFETEGPADYGIVFEDTPLPKARGEIVYDIQMDRHRSVLYSAGPELSFRMYLPDGSISAGFDFSDHLRAFTDGDLQSLHFVLWMATNLLSSEKLSFGVHSSCIACPEGAVIFLGESGTGKSTHTALWRKNFPDAFLLNDDSPFITARSEGILASGSPWSGKTACFIQESVPLRGIVRLRQAPYNQIRQLNTLEAFTAIYPSYPPAFAKVPFLRERVMKAVSDVISNVPVYMLDCLPDDDAARLSRKQILEK